MSKQTETKGRDKVQVGPRFVDHCSCKGRGKGLGLSADARELSRRKGVTQFWGGLLSKLDIFARGTQYCNENMTIYCTHTVRSYCTYYYFLPFYYSRFPLQSWMILHLRAAGVAAAAAQQWREGESQQQLQSGCGFFAGGRIMGIHKLQFDFFSRNFVCLPCDTIHLCNQNPVLQVILDLLLCLCVFVNLCICICVFVFYLCICVLK